MWKESKEDTTTIEDIDGQHDTHGFSFNDQKTKENTSERKSVEKYYNTADNHSHNFTTFFICFFCFFFWIDGITTFSYRECIIWQPVKKGQFVVAIGVIVIETNLNSNYHWKKCVGFYIKIHKK